MATGNNAGHSDVPIENVVINSVEVLNKIMAISFISDLHLDKSRPHINKYFIEYLNHLDKASRIYILGDLFEYWVGDDDPMDGLEEVRDAITI